MCIENATIFYMQCENSKNVLQNVHFFKICSFSFVIVNDKLHKRGASSIYNVFVSAF